MKKHLPLLARRHAVVAAVIASTFILHAPGFSQSSPEFDKTSLALRTALHFDPAADAPLKKLVELYATAGRRGELPALYLSHLSQYPDDANARVVLARVFIVQGDDRAAGFLRESIESHPQSALLAWTHHQFLASRLEPRALDELDRAIGLEPAPARRALWLDALLKLASERGREDLVTQRFKALVNSQVLDVAQRIRWARQALNRSLPKAAAAMVQDVDVSTLQGDAAVEAALVLAESEAASGQRIEAGRRLDELLGKLAADYWRRREVLLLRLHITGDAADRDQFIEAARRRYEAAPGNEAEVIAYAELLTAAQRKNAAIEVLQKAAARLPESRLVEARLLDLLDTTNRETDAIAFLTARLQATPAREDLALQRVRLLLATGRRQEGSDALDQLLKGRVPEQRAATHLDTARWLRTRNLLSEAAAVLERLVSEQPQRWDARKELGELYVVLKRADDLDKLFSAKIADEVAPEVRMEVVQFLVAQKQWVPARAALETWLESRQSDLEGRLLLVRIHAVTGDIVRADTLMAESRALCDTDARYAAWLHAAFKLAEESGDESGFVGQERQRIWPVAGGAWDAPRLARLLALADLAGNAKLDEDVEKLVRAALADASLNAEQRKELQLRLLNVIERQTGREKEVESQLVELARSPGANADDLNLRLALLYHSAKRFDLALSTMEQLHLAACQDAALLTRAAGACTEMDSLQTAAGMLRRVVELQPEDMSGWIQWTSALVTIGDEHALRLALRQMLSLSTKWKLNAASSDLLRRHLAASCWREAGRLICREPMERDTARRALIVLDEAAQLEVTAERRHWIEWTRARLVGTGLKEAPILPKTGWIPFPDGLELAADQVDSQFADQTQVAKTSVAHETGAPPLAPLDLAWGFESEAGSRILRFRVSPDGTHVLVADDRSVLSVLNRRTGKLCWSTKPASNGRASRSVPASPFSSGMRMERVVVPLEFVADETRTFLLLDDRIECRRLSDGAVTWTCAASTTLGGDLLAVDAGRLLCWRPADGRLDARDVFTGKLLWTRSFGSLKKPPPSQAGYQTAIGTGVSADAGKVLVYANGVAIMRIADGAVLWRTSEEEPPAFPLEVHTVEETGQATPSLPVVQVPWIASGPQSLMFGRNVSSSLNPLIVLRSYPHPLKININAYAGMYGSQNGSLFLKWGSEGVRALHGDAIWTFSNGMPEGRVTLSGIPVTSDEPGLVSSTGMLIGFAGGRPVTVNETAVVRHSVKLWHSLSEARYNSPVEQSFPAAAVLGRTVLVASAEGLLARDAVSGVEIFRCELPAAAKSWAKDAWEQLKSFQSVRWSAHGVVFYDGQGGSLVVDWRSAAHDGDWIIPLGLNKLGCLRGTRQTASLPVK